MRRVFSRSKQRSYAVRDRRCSAEGSESFQHTAHPEVVRIYAAHETNKYEQYMYGAKLISRKRKSTLETFFWRLNGISLRLKRNDKATQINLICLAPLLALLAV